MAIKHRLKALALCAICLSLTVAGCGRRGALDVPGQQQSTSLDAPGVQLAPTGPESATDSEAPREKSPFFLDFFIETW